MRTRSAGLAALALVVLGAGCGAGDEADEGEAVQTVYVSGPLSGPARAEGEAAMSGAAEALADAEAMAGGHEVAVEYLDSAGRNESSFDPVVAAANARAATEDSTTIAYIGELDSGGTRSSLPITNSAGVLQVAPGSGASDLVREETYNDDVPTEVQGTGERTYAQLVPTYEPGERPSGGDPADLGYEAMASVLAAIDRAADPLDRQSVIDAYFDGTERDSRLGRYRIAETGEFEPL